jgi:hypothetical protein
MLSEAELEKQTQAPTLVAIALGFISATTVVIVLRMYTRLFMLRMAGPDDWSVLVAMVCPCLEHYFGCTGQRLTFKGVRDCCFGWNLLR